MIKYLDPFILKPYGYTPQWKCTDSVNFEQYYNKIKYNL